MLSASIVVGPTVPYNEDRLVIGSLCETKHNIVAVLATGNDGPSQETV